MHDVFCAGIRRAMIVGACVGLVAATAAAQGITQPKQGQGGSVVKGAAGTDGSTGDKGLEHCDKPMGAMAVVEVAEPDARRAPALPACRRRSA